MLMRNFVMLAVVLVLAPYSAGGAQALHQEGVGQAPQTPFAVVELFSSEGCSSCPAADLLISKLTAWARQNNKPVYPLIFHVDYWNGLGWRDVFSREAFTHRQSLYAHAFKEDQIFTPQIIVNGTDSIAGANQGELQSDLDHELSIPAPAALRLSLSRSANRLTVSAHCEGYTQGDVLNVAVVERGLSTDVTAGENAGRVLHHDNVVREFQTVKLVKADSRVEVPLDKISNPAQASVVAYIQNPGTMLIEAAGGQDLPHD